MEFIETLKMPYKDKQKAREHRKEYYRKNKKEIKKAFAPENHKLLLIEEHRKLNHRTKVF